MSWWRHGPSSPLEVLRIVADRGQSRPVDGHRQIEGGCRWHLVGAIGGPTEPTDTIASSMAWPGQAELALGRRIAIVGLPLWAGVPLDSRCSKPRALGHCRNAVDLPCSARRGRGQGERTARLASAPDARRATSPG